VSFFGESMFHRVRDASKVALVALVEHLHARKFALLDTQWLTPHLAIRRNRNFAHSLFACPTESVGIAQKILGYGAPPGAPAVWRMFAICEARQRNIQSCATIRLSQTAATMFGVRS